MERIVLAYSGGLDSSAAIPWLKEHYQAEVIAVTIDLGQGRALESVRDRARASGALRAHVLDLREEFVRDFVLPALKADALYDDRSPMMAALSRPLVARAMVDIARIEHATAVAHGANGRRVALDVLVRALSPKMKIIGPAREWGMSRADVLDYARRWGIETPPDPESPYRVESNLWGRSIECRALEDEPPESIYALTRPATACPDEPAYVEIAFERGVPSAINDVVMPPLELIGSLGLLAAAHGVGRIDVVEHRVAGMRLREVGEAPAAVLLHAAHKELRRVSVSRELERVSRITSAEYAEVIYGGLWFSPLRDALAAFIDVVQDRITGVVRLKLFKGAYSVVGRRVRLPSPRKLKVISVAKRA